METGKKKKGKLKKEEKPASRTSSNGTHGTPHVAAGVQDSVADLHSQQIDDHLFVYLGRVAMGFPLDGGGEVEGLAPTPLVKVCDEAAEAQPDVSLLQTPIIAVENNHSTLPEESEQSQKWGLHSLFNVQEHFPSFSAAKSFASKIFLSSASKESVNHHHNPLNQGKALKSSDKHHCSKILDMGSKDDLFLIDPQAWVSTDVSLISQFIPKVINVSDNELICNVPNEEEVTKAVWDHSPDSAAGPDGYNGYFFRQCWNIIKLDVILACQEFFLGIPVPSSFGSTFITLIPKSEDPKSFGDYRTISLSTFMRKIISKILASRLSVLLPKCISEEQTGFQKNKGVEEQILLTEEMVHMIDKNTRGDNYIVKLDMAKAFDKVEWEYLEAILDLMGFNERSQQLLMANLKEEGGLGIRSLEDTQEAYSIKLWWKVQTDETLWAKYMRARNLHHKEAERRGMRNILSRPGEEVEAVENLW
ncbi:unnamed protein product [Cuscuta campestris]|uniref:Reverse transcriptase domain-containing protein n=1 Tax=Cuscuta campestris TaxID=132261 RepID=A0A484LA03_9ASTE|nr:unnamed protein product [Cuscuta campestris]